jgi:hypothetical protein
MKLGSDILTLTTAAKSAIQNLTKNDVTVFWEGTNVVGKDYMKEALKCLRNFVMNNSHTKIISMQDSHMHDFV